MRIVLTYNRKENPVSITTPQSAVEPRNGLGIAAISIAVVGVLFGLVPLTGFIAVGAGLVAAILALAARGRIKRGRATNRKTTWAALIVALGSIALGIWGMTIVFGAVEQLDKDFQQFETEMNGIDKQFQKDMDCLDTAVTAEEIAAC